MNIQLKTLLCASAAMLAFNTATAKTVSNTLTLDQGLNCLDLIKKEQSFTNQLAMGEWGNMAKYGMASINQQFKQQYRQQPPQIIDEDDENYCDDCPEPAVYIPKNKNNPIKRIETMMQVSSIGASTLIYRSDDISITKQKIENGLKIKLSSYTGQQFKTFKQQWDKALKANENENDVLTKTNKVFQQYPHLKTFSGEVYQNEKFYIPKQIYIYSQTYKRDPSDFTSLVAYINLYDNPVDPSQHILQCGFMEN